MPSPKTFKRRRCAGVSDPSESSWSSLISTIPDDCGTDFPVTTTLTWVEGLSTGELTTGVPTEVFGLAFSSGASRLAEVEVTNEALAGVDFSALMPTEIAGEAEPVWAAFGAEDVELSVAGAFEPFTPPVDKVLVSDEAVTDAG